MTFYDKIDIKLTDPVSAMALSEKYIVIGTMMGRLLLYSIESKQSHILKEFLCENITGIQFYSEDVFYVSVGDDEILQYKLTVFENQMSSEIDQFKNYEDELIHRTKCDNNITLLAKSSILIVSLPSNDTGEKAQLVDVGLQIRDYTERNPLNRELILGMSNFSVPFDFNFNIYVWLEFEEEQKRNICFYNFDSMSTIRHPLTKEIGHISFCKFINRNLVLIVRMHNLVEFRTLKDFKTIKSFLNIGEEVVGVDFYNNLTKIVIQEPDNVFKPNNANSNTNLQINNDQVLKISEEKKLKDKDSHLIQMNEENEETISVVLLDLDGNLNIYENASVTTKCNLYNLKDISDEIKEKQFFSMGYPYYIRANNNFFVVSTDYGVFLVKREI